MLRQQYQQDMDKMKKIILHMGAIAYDMFEQSMDAFWNQDEELAKDVTEMDNTPDMLERSIEVTAIHLISLQQPLARDTRELICAIRIATDLERVSDHAVDISEYALYEQRNKVSDDLMESLTRIRQKTGDMLLGAMKAYETRDIELAYRIAEMDDDIDVVFWNMRTSIMNGNPYDIPLQVLILAEHIERIADYATNICEEVVYLVKYEHVKLN
ncbi:Phosphate-specific transport system accessory protein PhoU [Methanosarcinaceae archaeon Ag5]|uniref:Phosphate-specific transport system accessory protein PhoU n=1 Tax=Methanolapillus africanus TaxID=3028297 RepID=A0AAE4MJP3_9EURY|nr:Phosphate-specific transport system accessory protein PhoU [Methanosarcinaceae archaeon Ag5]